MLLCLLFLIAVPEQPRDDKRRRSHTLSAILCILFYSFSSTQRILLKVKKITYIPTAGARHPDESKWWVRDPLLRLDFEPTSPQKMSRWWCNPHLSCNEGESTSFSSQNCCKQDQSTAFFSHRSYVIGGETCSIVPFFPLFFWAALNLFL